MRRAEATSTTPPGELTVLHLLGPLRLSGAEMMLICASDMFTQAGIRSLAVSIEQEAASNSADDFRSAGMLVIHLGGGRTLSWLRSYWRTLREQRVDCVHVHAERASIATSVLPRLLGVRVVRTVHNAFDFSGPLRARKIFERWIARSVGVSFVAVSPSVHSNECERFRNELTLILNWFDDRRFAPPTPSDREAAREQFEVDDRIVLAVVGNCSIVKNHALLFRALALCSAPDRPLVLHAGAPEDPDHEADLVATLGIHDDVRFLGPTSDVVPLLHATDAFVMPSMYEGLPIAAIEAAATGLKLIVADVAGLRDLATLLPNVDLVPLDSGSLGRELLNIPALDATDEARVEMSAKTRVTFDRERGVVAYVALYRRARDERTA